MANFQPKEVLYDRAMKSKFEQAFGTKYCTFELDDWVFTEQTARQKLLGHFKTKSLEGLWCRTPEEWCYRQRCHHAVS